MLSVAAAIGASKVNYESDSCILVGLYVYFGIFRVTDPNTNAFDENYGLCRSLNVVLVKNTREANISFIDLSNYRIK